MSRNLLQEIDALGSDKRKSFPDFQAGDTIKVHIKVKEGEKERIQIFTGTVVQRRHPNTSGETFTVIKYSGDMYIEKIFPTLCTSIQKIELVMRGKVRRARIFYIRERRGKAARIKEKKQARVQKK